MPELCKDLDSVARLLGHKFHAAKTTNGLPHPTHDLRWCLKAPNKTATIRLRACSRRIEQLLSLLQEHRYIGLQALDMVYEKNVSSHTRLTNGSSNLGATVTDADLRSWVARWKDLLQLGQARQAVT